MNSRFSSFKIGDKLTFELFKFLLAKAVSKIHCFNQRCESGPISVEAKAQKFYRFRFHTGGKNRGKKEIGSDILRRAKRGSINPRNESEEESFREMLTFTQSE